MCSGGLTMDTYPTPCENEICTMVFKEFERQKASTEQLKIENEVLKLTLSDSTTTNENAIRELKRLLEKEKCLTNLANTQLTPDPSGIYPSCAQCMHHKQQAKLMREANAQEFAWVSHFAKSSKNMRLELQDALLKEKARHLQLRSAYEELHAKKTDPFGRDPEVARLRAELQEAKQHQSNANQTAWTANRVTETLRKELQNAQARVVDLEAENRNQAVRIKKFEEVVEAYKRSDDLKNQPVGECKDYLCLKRAMDSCNKEREYRTQIAELQRENAYNMTRLMQMKNGVAQWKSLTGEEEEAEAEPAAADETMLVAAEEGGAAKRAKRIPKAILVADLANYDELRMSICALYMIWAALSDGEMDTDQLLHNLLLDIAPFERKQTLLYMLFACHGGQMPGGVREDEVNQSNRLVKDCFVACIRSLGGVSRKGAGGRLVWTNVRQNRCPIYKA